MIAVIGCCRSCEVRSPKVSSIAPDLGSASASMRWISGVALAVMPLLEKH